MTELDSSDSRAGEARHREGARWRESRRACPHPDLLVARRSDVLEPAVRQALANHLDACAACTRLAADLDSLALDEPDDELANRVRARLMPHRRRPSMRLLAWAAAIVLAAGIGVAWWMRAPDARPPITGANEPAPAQGPAPATPAPAPLALWTVTPPPVRIPLTAMGSTRSRPREAGADALLEALEGYRGGRFADSIPALEALAGRYPQSGDVTFYLGVSYLLADRPADAARLLERARPGSDATRAAEIEWYLASAQHRAGQNSRALPRLQALCGGTSSYRSAACDAARMLR